jgi:hypothetical protein
LLRNRGALSDKRLTRQGYVNAINIVNLGYRRQVKAPISEPFQSETGSFTSILNRIGQPLSLAATSHAVPCGAQTSEDRKFNE